eukprot:Phypoly_transcript_00467.p1 GENE.Phypoly_transcript_00467~~Phypoly_transcript_00467.p1  ORF type:complete len:1577 (+),score=152.41 Phypoly_transcript_00467:25-4731(+)
MGMTHFPFLLLFFVLCVNALDWVNTGGTHDIEAHYGDVAGPGSRTFAHTWTASTGNFYLYGGIGFANNCTNRVIYGDLWMYIPGTQTWSSIPQNSSPGPLAGGVTWVAENQQDVYIYGGLADLSTYDNYSKTFSKPTVSAGVMYCYNTQNNSWQTLHQSVQVNYTGNEPGARLLPAAWVQDEKFMLLGGMDINGDIRRDLWVFDSNYLQWAYDASVGDQLVNQRSNNSLPACLFGTAVSVSSANVYFVGGRNFLGDTAEGWRLAANTWHPFGGLQKGTSFAAIYVSPSDIITIIGGYSNTGPIGDIVQLDSTGSEISRVVNVTFDPRFGIQVWSNRLYGGTGIRDAVFSDMWQLNSNNVLAALTTSNWVQLPTQIEIGQLASARANAMTWTDSKNGDMWIFGGQPVYTCFNFHYGLTDMWRITQNLAYGVVHTKQVLLQTPQARVMANTWTDDLGRFWMFSGRALSEGTIVDLLCDMWVFDPSNPFWTPVATCSPGEGVARTQAATWYYKGSLYLFGGIGDGEYLSSMFAFSLNDLIWAPVPVLGPVPDVDTYSYVSWLTDDYVYLYGSLYCYTWRWDLEQNNWVNITNGTTPGYVTDPISWTSPNKQIYLSPNQAGTVWFFTPGPNTWMEVSAPSLSPFKFIGSKMPIWESSFVFAWATQAAYGGVGMFQLDLCEESDCDTGDACRHYPTLGCVSADDIFPVTDFQFSKSLISEDRQFAFTLNPTGQANVNYVTSDCGEALNITNEFAYSDPATSVWRTATDDFSLGIRVNMDFTGSDFHTIIATTDCTTLRLDYFTAEGQIQLRLGTIVANNTYHFATSDYHQILITRSATYIQLFIDGTLVVQTTSAIYITEALQIGAICQQGGVSAQIDELAIYDLAVTPSIFDGQCQISGCPCPENAQCILRECQCFPSYIASGSTCSLNALPCPTGPQIESYIDFYDFEASTYFNIGTLVSTNTSLGCGNYSLQVNGPANSSLAIPFVEQFTFTIHFTGWVRAEVGALGSLILNNIVFNLAGPFGWQEIVFGTNQSTNMIVMITFQAISGVFYLDDFSLTMTQLCDPSQCGAHEKCEVLNGNDTCSCSQGYTRDSFGNCVENQSCDPSQCGIHETCVNGTSTCVCSQGYMKDSFGNCVDKNECLFDNGGCDKHVTCVNQPGNFTCPPCPALFNGSSYTKCLPLCGDAYCNATLGEDCVSCPFDCKNSSCKTCGDGICDTNENCQTCFDDCRATCGIKRCQVQDCSKHGTCQDGTCICEAAFSGPSCNEGTVKVNVTSNSTDPIVTISPVTNTQTTFSIFVSKIQELQSGFSVLSEFPLQGNFTKSDSTTSTTTVFNFVTTLSNDAQVNITIQYFNSATTTIFANKTTSLAANTLKVNVNVKNWPFRSAQNYLAVILDAASAQQTTQACNLDSNTNSNGSLTWYVLTINGVAMYAQFSPDAVLDGRNRIVTFSLDPNTGQVRATIPHFWDEMDLDPTYSVLLGKAKDKCTPKHHSNVRTTVYIAVFVTVGVLVIIGVALYFLYPKIHSHLKVRKHAHVELQSVPSVTPEHNPEIEKASDMEAFTHAGKFVVRM